MAPKSLGFMVLFLWFQRAANVTKVIGIIGGSAEMECIYSGEEPFVLNKFRIIWQKKDFPCPVNIYSPGEDVKSYQCKEFKNRTLFSEQLKKGNFSLRLLDIRPADEYTYECVVLQNKSRHYDDFNTSTVTLKVAAYYSKPVINVIEQSGEDKIFICNSSHGYPQAKLTWINQTDNSTLNPTEYIVTRNPNETFSISSILKIKATSDTKLGCRMENPLLHQNIITTLDEDSSTDSARTNSDPNQRLVFVGTVVIGIVVIAAIVIAIILYIYRNKRRHSHQRAYTGVCENEEAEHCNGPVELENTQRL